MVKYYCTEMGNRVCYQALQVHGGTGYMQEFNVERHVRDVRITNIYEGTSQLQVVAAIGGLMGHALDGLLNDLAAQDYGEPLADLKKQLEETNSVFIRCIDHLKEGDREVIDYYASDVVDAASYLFNSWLMLEEGKSSERKQDLARIYIAEAIPVIRNKIDVLKALDPAPFKAKETILAAEF
jgi:hypothetical protein